MITWLYTHLALVFVNRGCKAFYSISFQEKVANNNYEP